jgi:hypothetical protein
MMAAVRAIAIVALWTVGAITAGCGGSQPPAPPKEARLAVGAFLRATQEQRFSTACELLTPEAQADLRITVLGSFRPMGSTFAARQRQVAASHNRARTCPGTLELLAYELGSSRVTELRHRVTSAHVSFLGSARQIVVLDDQAWVVTQGDDGWRIASSNAISDALPPT